MIIQTRTKIILARFIAHIIVALRQLVGLGAFINVKRDGFDWHLNLLDGIDFSIYLLGSFEPKTQIAFKKLIRVEGVGPVGWEKCIQRLGNT